MSAVTGTSTRVATVDHWFDVTCPFCYVAQDRNRILRAHGIRVVEHALQIHPEIGPGGIPAGSRTGPMYEFLAQEAKAADLPLRWTDRIGYARPALAAFEYLNRTATPEIAERFAAAVFTAYFAQQQDIESPDLLTALAIQAGANPDNLRAALISTEATDLLAQSESLARAHGVNSTPTWIVGGQRVSGLRPREWFEDWAKQLAGQ